MVNILENHAHLTIYLIRQDFERGQWDYGTRTTNQAKLIDSFSFLEICVYDGVRTIVDCLDVLRWKYGAVAGLIDHRRFIGRWLPIFRRSTIHLELGEG
nr:hypothetical protein Iba_chr02cCG17520 [Ipomoea batatas]